MRNTQILKKLISVEGIAVPAGVTKTKGPYKPVRARTLGYKNTPEYVTYVCSVPKGGISARPTKKGRKPQNLCRKYSRDISHKQRAINRVSKNRKNLTLIGAYEIKKDKYRVFYQLLFKVKT